MAFVRRLRVAGAYTLLGTVIGVVGAIVRRGPDNPFFSEPIALDPARLRMIAKTSFAFFLVAFVMLTLKDFAERPIPPEPKDPSHRPQHLDSPHPRT